MQAPKGRQISSLGREPQEKVWNNNRAPEGRQNSLGGSYGWDLSPLRGSVISWARETRGSRPGLRFCRRSAALHIVFR